MEKVFFDKSNSYSGCGDSGRCDLSDQNLTAETNTCMNVGTNVAIRKGKIYWEIKVLKDSGYGFIGIVGSKTDISQRLIFRLMRSGGYFLNYSQVISALDDAAYKVGDIVAMALDTEKNSVIVSVNGMNKGTVNLITDQNMFYPAVGNASSDDGLGFKATANFGATPFAYPIPKGYTSLVKRQKHIYLKGNEVYGVQQAQ